VTYKGKVYIAEILTTERLC